MEDADTNGHVDPGVSIRFGPVQGKDPGDDAESGAAKRKSRISIDQPRKSYAEPESSEEDDQPLVRDGWLPSPRALAYVSTPLTQTQTHIHTRLFTVAVDCNG